MSLHAWLAGLAVGAGLIVAIGAQNAFVLRQGLQRRHVGAVVAVCVAADVALILLGTAGMGVAVGERPLALLTVRYLGAAFLFAYGLLAARRAWVGGTALQPEAPATTTRTRAIALCLGFTLLNPHVYLDTVLLLGSVSARYGDARWWFAAGACGASLAWFVALGYGARLLVPWFRDPRAWRVLDAAVAGVMVVLACGLLRATPG